MDELLAQIILAARNPDVENWMNILFIVIIAAFWAISGIIRARAKKAPNEGEEISTEKQARSQQRGAKDLRDEVLQRFRHARSAGTAAVKRYPRQDEQVRVGMKRAGQSRPEAARIATEKRAEMISAAESLEKMNLAKYERQIQPTILEHPEPESKAGEALKDKYTKIPSEKLQSVFPADLLPDFSNADDLRRAVLYYEILGKPLSLRDFNKDFTEP